MIDQANELRHLVQQRAEASSRPAYVGPSIITVAGGKGGVGTTTIAINLAVAMARQCDRVLLVDADPDRADVATFCELTAKSDLADLVIGGRSLEEVMTPGPDGIHIVSGTQQDTMSETSAGRFCEHWIESVREADEPFDYVIVDAGNGSSYTVKKLWDMAELILLVTTPELPSILDAYASIKSMADPAALPPIHSLVNRVSEPAVAYDVHGRLARAVWRFLGFHLDSAGHLAAAPSQSLGESAPFELPLAREFGQLARTLRTALRKSNRQRARSQSFERPQEDNKPPSDAPTGNGDEIPVCQSADS